MPSVSEKQARFFAAVAHDPQFAAKVGVPQKVGVEFNQADKGGKLLSMAMKHRGNKKRSPLHDLMMR